MVNALRAPDRRTLAILGSGLLVAVCLGAVAGHSPLIAVGLLVGAAIAVVMFGDLALGAAVFVVGSFAQVLSAGSAASASKGLGLLLVLAWVAALAKRSRVERRALLSEHRGLVALAVLLVAWSMVSAVWAQDRSTAVAGASRYAQDLVLFPIFYTAVRRPVHGRWMAAAFIAGALGSSTYGVLTGSTVDGSRLVGSLGDPNETAAVMVAAAVLALALGIGQRRSALRRRAAFAAAALALLAMVATASRGGLVALAAAALIAVACGGRWRAPLARGALVGAVLVAGWFLLLAPASSRSHITSTQSGRTTLWTVAGRAISASPVVGLGNDNFQVAANRYLLAPGQTTAADQILVLGQPAHNVYLEIWADLGIVGLLLFAGLVAVSLRSGIAAAGIFERDGRRAEELLARGLVVASGAMLAASFFLSDQYSKQLYLLLAFNPAMLAAARASIGGRHPTRRARRPLRTRA
jgi:putative inorganic carbon (HCO3(-)) transporter